MGNSSNSSAALATQAGGALAHSGQVAQQLKAAKDLLGLDDALVRQAVLLAARMPAPSPKRAQNDRGQWILVERAYSLQQLLTAADIELRTGQVCGRDFYLDPDMGVIGGYRGAQAQVGQQRFDVLVRSRVMTEEEAREFGIIDGDVGFIAEAYSETTKEVLTTGYGVMTFDELWITEEWTGPKGNRQKVKLAKPKPKYPTAFRPRYWKGHKRAKVDALNQLMGLRPVGAQAVIEAAQREGLKIDISEETIQRLSHEQAQDYARSLRMVSNAPTVVLTAAQRAEQRLQRAKDVAGWEFMDDMEREEFLSQYAADNGSKMIASPAQYDAVDDADADDDASIDENEEDAEEGGSELEGKEDYDLFVKMVEYALEKRAYETTGAAERALRNLLDMDDAGMLDKPLRDEWLALVAKRVAERVLADS